MDDSKLKNLSYELYKMMLFIHNKLFDPSELAKHAALPFSHIKVLFFLTKHNNASISDIAGTLSVSRSNMTPIIDKLLEEGVIDRYTDPNDRRVYRVKLTDKGYEFIKCHEEVIKSNISKKLSGLDMDSLDRLDYLVLETKKILDKIES